MAVKDLVQQYEQAQSPPGSGSRTSSHLTQQRSHHSARTPVPIEVEGDAVDHELQPQRARFLNHATRPNRRSSPDQTDTHASPYASTLVDGTPAANRKSQELSLKAAERSVFIQSEPTLIASGSDSSIPTLSADSGEPHSGKHDYPPRSVWSDDCEEPLRFPHQHMTHSRRRSTQQAHQPIPAPVIFSRNALPLSLPNLDCYLSSLPAPILGDGCDDSSPMFPPLDALAKSVRSLDDLETNSTVAPVWRNRSTILGGTINILIAFLGSSALASFYSLQGLINTVQIFALILSTIVPVGGHDLKDKWRKLFLGTIPNVLALNFAPALFQSLIFLLVVMTIASCLLYYFYRATIQCDRYTSIEGLQQTETQGKQWMLVIVTFLLTVLYLPLSTMSVHVLVWSEELWPIPNPYLNATQFPPSLPPLGSPSEFRDPLDFCWTTTMKRNEVNWAPVVVVLSAVVFLVFAVWFPIALRRVIQRSVPKVDKFTELGRPRSHVDMDGEYHLLLDRDRNPFNFLYSNFRRGWGTYISTYLFAKLSTLVIIAVVDPNNCFFRSFSRTSIPIARQSLLLTSTLGFFVAQCIYTPFMDPINNASEWTSRLNYLTTSITALAITLNIPGRNIIDSYVLYCIYVITYGLGFYFSVISFAWMQRNVKRLTRRIDFSVDIFSPRLDTSSTSIHTKRRIWQESITALMLTDLDCAIPPKQPMAFAQSRDSRFPPYLLDFMGTPGERHVENLKIFREVGSYEYNRAVELSSGPDFALYQHLEDVILKNFIGPDSYWKPLEADEEEDKGAPGCHNFFGNAWWIPFPPTLVIRYDDGQYAVAKGASELRAYIEQNSSRAVQQRCLIRMSLRALEGQIVQWPYDHFQPVGSQGSWCCGSRYHAVSQQHYGHAVLSIKRRGHLAWQGMQLGSGFDIQLKFAKGVQTGGDVIGLNDDFDLTSTLARFLAINKQLIDERLFAVEEVLAGYRRHHRKEFRWKAKVLSYKSLTFVYDRPRDPNGLAQSSIEFEKDQRVCRLMSNSERVFSSAYFRLSAVSKSEAATWWYIFWDDLWRRNHDTVSGLEKYPTDFNPHYRTCIAYTPLPRAALETFLKQRGLLHTKPRWGDFFHTGFLNKLYLRLNDAVFRDSRKAIMFHVDDDRRELAMEDVDVLTQGGQTSTLGTGPGTDHNYSGIRVRPAYRWEGMFNAKHEAHYAHGSGWRRRWASKFGAWLGVTPLWLGVGSTSHELYLDVKLEGGKYVLMDAGTDYEGSKRGSNGAGLPSAGGTTLRTLP
ncbi:hypothetical protein D9619_003561 [Psilocybe cf. subviscida]|uniref:Uncharacterized protein n=1 Tax=Psilocybe cf. subviscida TaxID=2480587 RepID=A0A8H5AX26_9AGAR|nr:hypothetical protein D9619_003561 [Psilocybe cf. subviscida]